MNPLKASQSTNRWSATTRRGFRQGRERRARQELTSRLCGRPDQLNGYAGTSKRLGDLVKTVRHQETQVHRPARGVRCMRSQLRACLMQVQLLTTETQSNSPLAKRLSPHPERLVELDGRVDVRNRENQVVERPDVHAHKASGDARGRATLERVCVARPASSPPEKGQATREFPQPSNGLEPLTPSLPRRPRGW